VTDNQELLIPVSRAAERVSLSAKTIRKLIKQGKFPYKRVGRKLLVPTAALEAWARADWPRPTQTLDKSV